MSLRHHPLVLLGVAAALSVTEASIAKAEQPRSSGFRADVETDPTAFALRGYSLHVGLGYDHVRVDLGTFALTVPDFIHGNDGFDESANGYGLKLQYFLSAEQRGFFAGVELGLARYWIELENNTAATRHVQFNAGVLVGYRISLPAGFYVTPWIGLDYAFNADDTVLDGQRFEASPWIIFPAIHVGYVLR